MKLTALQHGREWLADHGFESRLYLQHGLDGLASGALLTRRAAGEVSFASPFAGQLDRRGPIAVVAQGVKPIQADGPVLFLDHHPDPSPVEATVVWDGAAESTSTLAWRVLGAPTEGEWLSALGIFGCRISAGIDTEALEREWPDVRRIATLCAAATRLSGGPMTAALTMLRDASSPGEALRLPAARQLIVARHQLEEMTLQASRIAPRLGPTAAIAEIDAPGLIHPQLASAWARRLTPWPVLIANYGWRAGAVAYSVRCADPDALAEWLDAVAAAAPDVAGHLKTPDGTVSLATYRTLLKAIDA